MTTYDAILPAGGTIDPDFAKEVGTDVKALIKFGDETILERTLRVLKESGQVGRTVVIGGETLRNSEAAKKADVLLPEGKSGPDNILRGLTALLESPNPPDKVLVVTTDLPFLTPQIVNDFIAACPTDKDICVPLVSKSQYQARFPNSTATFVPLKDDVWTTGCIYLMDVKALAGARVHMEKIFANRKSKLGMARLLGPGFLIKFLMKSLTVRDVEQKIQVLLGCSGAAVRNTPPELAYDIDFMDDYEYALTQLKVTA